MIGRRSNKRFSEEIRNKEMVFDSKQDEIRV
jgi:hypothetical protein